MSLHLGGVLGTGTDTLDINVSDSVMVTTPNDVLLVTTTGASGGLVVYRMQAGGQLVVADSRLFPDALQGSVASEIAAVELDGETLVIFGGDSDSAFGYVLRDNGQLGALRQVDWSVLENAAARAVPGAAEALALYDGIAEILVGTQIAQDSPVSVQSVTGASQNYVLTLDAATGQLFSHATSNNGGMSQIAALGADDGLALANPTAMEIAQFGNTSFVVIASATGSSISVVEVLPDGRLTPVQQIVDTAATRFANVQDLTIVQRGEHAFVLAVGADHGVSLFRLLPDGHLVFVESFSDDRTGLLNTPSSVSATFVDDTLHVFIGTQDTAQIVHLESEQSDLGMVRVSSAEGGGALAGGGRDDVLVSRSDNDTLRGEGGDDILSSGNGRSTLTGGAGRDTFVIRAESSTVRVTDFRPGQDRLDLSDLPMLRNLDQLDIETTGSGAIIRFRNTEIIVTSSEGGSLRRADLFPDGLQGPDSMIILAGELDPVPGPEDGRAGLFIQGTNASEELFGDSGADTIHGERGNDKIYGLAGRDLLVGGMGHDRIWGGGAADTLRGETGNDRLYGGGRNDRLLGNDGDDRLFGQAGRDRLLGHSGNDTLVGNGGRDRLFGASGDDDLLGGNGNDKLWGGPGADALKGGTGDDLLRGGAGDDRLLGGKGRDTLLGGTADDLIRAGGAGDTVRGQNGHDKLFGNTGDDRLLGNAGNDVLNGGNGSDTLNGGAGHDRLVGGAGEDRILPRNGDDTAFGGGGADVFVFREQEDSLTIEDFSFRQGDILELDPDLWGGGLSPAEIIDRFATVVDGSIVLDFGDGDVVTLSDVSDTTRLEDHIEFL